MYYTPYICHHGVKGMKWGVRRQKVREFVRSNRVGAFAYINRTESEDQTYNRRSKKK